MEGIVLIGLLAQLISPGNITLRSRFGKELAGKKSRIFFTNFPFVFVAVVTVEVEKLIRPGSGKDAHVPERVMVPTSEFDVFGGGIKRNRALLFSHPKFGRSIALKSLFCIDWVIRQVIGCFIPHTPTRSPVRRTSCIVWSVAIPITPSARAPGTKYFRYF